jgi:hypothetical protein
MSDRYMKIVLPVIAVCLMKLAFGDFVIPSVNAQRGIQRVAICDEATGRCATVRWPADRIQTERGYLMVQPN